jgi:hypothetical protein
MNWTRIFCAAMLASGAVFAQGWEVGVIGGFSDSPSLDVKSTVATGSAGLGRGTTVGVYGGEDMYRYWGGEARYLYGFGDLRLSSGSTSVSSFSRSTHLITGDILAYFRPTSSKFRPFAAFGGGVEVVGGTGAESASQPLGYLVALTHTRETVPVGDVGIGIKFAMTDHVRLRLEGHDYIGKTPTDVLAPAPGVSIGGVTNNFVGSVSIGFGW